MAEEEEGEETWTRTHSEQEKSRGMKNQSVRVLRVLLVDNYDSYTFNVYQMLSDLQLDDPRGPEVGGGDTTTTFEVKVDVIYNNSTRWTDLRPKVKDVYDAIVLSPGPGTPACESDIGICKDIPESCVDVPILGICLGHQALASQGRSRSPSPCCCIKLSAKGEVRAAGKHPPISSDVWISSLAIPFTRQLNKPQ